MADDKDKDKPKGHPNTSPRSDAKDMQKGKDAAEERDAAGVRVGGYHNPSQR